MQKREKKAKNKALKAERDNLKLKNKEEKSETEAATSAAESSPPASATTK